MHKQYQFLDTIHIWIPHLLLQDSSLNTIAIITLIIIYAI